MPRVRFILPEVKTTVKTRPTNCPYCPGITFQRHGALSKPLKDLHFSQVQVVRYRCTTCWRTFRHYPQGVDSHDQSQRLRALAALLWGMGLSHQAVSHLLMALGQAIAKMTSWRDVQEMGEALSRKPRPVGRGVVLGADETVVKVKGAKIVVGLLVEPEKGELIGMELLVEQESEAFYRWLQEYTQELGVKALVSDDLSTYKPVVEALGLEHQVCLAHVRKNVTRRLKKNLGWEKEKGEIQALIKGLPEGGGKALLELEKEVRGEPRLRELVVELCQKWRRLVCWERIDGVPKTNNRTEQVIGRSKIRYKLMRGFKSLSGMHNALWLTQWVWRPGEIGDLATLIAR